MGFNGGSDSKESACNAGNRASIPGWRRSPGEGNHQPTPVFLPGESHEHGSLAGYSPWSCKYLDMTEWSKHTIFICTISENCYKYAS